jgi:hypothetical protein
MDTLIITPKTKVGQLLETYPQLEAVLLEVSPAFAKLKNPVLRKTVARVASLQQAALVGNVDVAALVNRLRNAVGQASISEVAGITLQTNRPEWFQEDKIHSTTEVQPLLDQGQQPVHVVLGELKSLPTGKIHCIIAPFLPAPLIEKAESLGYANWVAENEPNKCVVYFLGK